jgi:hypothetical protein
LHTHPRQSPRRTQQWLPCRFRPSCQRQARQTSRWIPQSLSQLLQHFRLLLPRLTYHRLLLSPRPTSAASRPILSPARLFGHLFHGFPCPIYHFPSARPERRRGRSRSAKLALLPSLKLANNRSRANQRRLRSQTRPQTLKRQSTPLNPFPPSLRLPCPRLWHRTQHLLTRSPPQALHRKRTWLHNKTSRNLWRDRPSRRCQLSL